MSDCRFGVSPVNYPDLDPVRVYAGDGWTGRQRMKRWVDLNVYMCVCARVCATLPACV